MKLTIRAITLSLLGAFTLLFAASWRHPQTVATLGTPSYETYTVTQPGAFRALRLPLPANSLVLWGGAVLSPATGLELNGDGTFSVNCALNAGDRITVVTFP